MKHVALSPIVKDGLFILTLWLVSRLVIVIALQWVAPLIVTTPVHPEWTWDARPHDFIPGYVPKPGWEAFSHWDGKWYRTIVTEGYEYVQDGGQHSIAFFPLFPLLIRVVMTLGLPFEVAAVLVNNLAFLGAMSLLYFWAKESQGTSVARWATAVLAWCPSSLFCTVVYSEGLFLLITTAALRAFDHNQYKQAAMWGALASATRVPGITLFPAFLFTAWKERRPPAAYTAAVASSGGLLLFCSYAAIAFGDPLAFVNTQQGWQDYHQSWIATLRAALTFQQKELLLVLALGGSAYLLWHLRRRLPLVAIAYGVCGLLLLLMAGSASFYRYLYGIVTLSFGLGVVLAKHRRWGYAVLLFFAVSLFIEAIHFATWDAVRWD
ncbi:mannosyltransferase family protein [Leptodesmis sp.]|uniref:mannosyltransferase family protein n=1 Tax=Leptodesmis sp. TaxID=3100501 RepID=UPI0040535ACC